MGFTQTQIDTLKAAIASGTRTVQYQDRLVTYQTIDDMLKALSVMEAEVNGGDSGVRLASFSRE